MSIWRPMLLAALIVLGTTVCLAYPLPEWFGAYAAVDDHLVELESRQVTLKPMRDNAGLEWYGFKAVDGQVTKLNTLEPEYILYDFPAATSELHVVRMVPKAVSDNPNDGFFWSPGDDVDVRIRPLDREGTYLFNPVGDLFSGYFLIYSGTNLGPYRLRAKAYLVELRHPREQEIYDAAFRFIGANMSSDREQVLQSSYMVDGKKPKKLESEVFDKLKKPFKYTGGGTVTPFMIQEIRDNDGTYWAVYSRISQQKLKVSGFGILDIGDVEMKIMFVREVAGELRVFVKRSGHWMFGE